VNHFELINIRGEDRKISEVQKKFISISLKQIRSVSLG